VYDFQVGDSKQDLFVYAITEMEAGIVEKILEGERVGSV